MWYSGAGGGGNWFMKKNRKQKISWHCLFNFLSQQLKMEKRMCVTWHVFLSLVDLFRGRELSVCTFTSIVLDRTKKKMWPFTLWNFAQCEFFHIQRRDEDFSQQTPTKSGGYGLAPSTHIPGVPQWLSPRWNWDSPPPIPQANVLPPGPKGGEGYTLACKWGGGGVPIRTTGEKA